MVSRKKNRGKKKRVRRREPVRPRSLTRLALLSPREVRLAERVPLEIVSLALIKKSKARARQVAAYSFDLHASWARQVSQRREDILRSLVSASVGPFVIPRWQRVLTYRYSMSPLSCAGSVMSQAGGRFNVGSFDPLNFSPFPALYLAEDRETAWAERYGHVLDNPSGLTPADLALTNTESVTYVSVSGTVQRVVDLRDPERLEQFVQIIAGFQLSSELLTRGRALGMSPNFPKDVRLLLDRLLDRGWRVFPMGFDTPSASQAFGQLVLAAGIEGIVFPSTRAKGGQACIALFPANFAGGSSSVAVDDAVPLGTTHTRLTAETFWKFLNYDELARGTV